MSSFFRAPVHDDKDKRVTLEIGMIVTHTSRVRIAHQ
jgi:hypothetical protein